MAMAMAMATYKSISVCSSATPATTAANSSCMLSSSYMPPSSFSLSSAVCVKKSTNCFGKLSLPRNLSSSLIWRSLQSPSSLGHWQEQKQKQSSFTVMALAKGKAYKMKTNKAAAKRFRVTGSGKLIRRRAGKQHLLVNKTKKRKKRLSKMAYVDKGDYRNVCKHLPYVKVNKKIAP